MVKSIFIFFFFFFFLQGSKLDSAKHIFTHDCTSLKITFEIYIIPHFSFHFIFLVLSFKKKFFEKKNQYFPCLLVNVSIIINTISGIQCTQDNSLIPGGINILFVYSRTYNLCTISENLGW